MTEENMENEKPEPVIPQHGGELRQVVHTLLLAHNEEVVEAHAADHLASMDLRAQAHHLVSLSAHIARERLLAPEANSVRFFYSNGTQLAAWPPDLKEPWKPFAVSAYRPGIKAWVLNNAEGYAYLLDAFGRMYLIPWDVSKPAIPREDYGEKWKAGNHIHDLCHDPRLPYVYLLNDNGISSFRHPNLRSTATYERPAGPLENHMGTERPRMTVDVKANRIYFTHNDRLWFIKGGNETRTVYNQAPQPVLHMSSSGQMRAIAAHSAENKIYYIEPDARLIMVAMLVPHQVASLGTGRQLRFRNPLGSARTWTVSMWYARMASSLDKGSILVSRGKGLELMQEGEDLLVAMVPDGVEQVIKVDGFFAGKGTAWTHLALSLDGRALKVYRDGSLAAAFDFEGAPVIGTEEISTGEGPLFSLAELRFWRRVQSVEEIKETMDHWLVGPQAQLAAYYRLDNHTHREFDRAAHAFKDVAFSDLSGHGLHGSFQGELKFRPAPDHPIGLFQILYKLNVAEHSLHIDANSGHVFWNDLQEDGYRYIMQGDVHGRMAPQRLGHVPVHGVFGMDAQGLNPQQIVASAQQYRLNSMQQAHDMVEDAHHEANKRLQAAYQELKDAKSSAEKADEANALKRRAHQELKQHWMAARRAAAEREMAQEASLLAQRAANEAQALALVRQAEQQATRIRRKGLD